MFQLLSEYNADVISPDIFPNSKRSLKSEVLMTISGRMRGRINDKIWGYKVMSNAGYSYNKNPEQDAYFSQTNAGACFLCHKSDFLKINLEEELWLDNMPYPLGEDQVMYYKMYCKGLKQITWYTHKIVHLDAGNNTSKEKVCMRLYGDVYFKIVFWHRFIFLSTSSWLKKLWSFLCILYYLLFTMMMSVLRFDKKVLKSKWKAMMDSLSFINSSEYNSLPIIKKYEYNTNCFCF